MFQPGGSIRAVLFDAVGTLIRPEPCVAAAYLNAARKHDAAPELDESQVDERFRAAFARQEALDRAAAWATDENRERRRWQEIVREVFGAGPRRDELFTALWNHFAQPRHWSVIATAMQQLAAARRAEMIVGIASNFDARLHQIIAGIPTLAGVHQVFVSSEIGWRKPSPRFFQAIQEQLGLAPKEILLIGDDQENDYEAAIAAGWQAILTK